MSRCRLASTAAVVVAVVLGAGPASAVVVPPPVGGARAGSNTDLVMSGTGPGQGVSGAIAPLNSTFDPTAQDYPAGPPDGFEPRDEGFAGIILGTPVGGPPNSVSLYCIDIRTSTWSGIGYVLGTWDASNVTNVGFVARLLNEYYPNTKRRCADLP
jgi:hypothetical protein